MAQKRRTDTYEKVFAAAESLADAGKLVTFSAVREFVPTGGNDTIKAAIVEWWITHTTEHKLLKEQNLLPPEAIELVSGLISTLRERLSLELQDYYKEADLKIEKALEESEGLRLKNTTLNERLESLAAVLDGVQLELSSCKEDLVREEAKREAAESAYDHQAEQIENLTAINKQLRTDSKEREKRDREQYEKTESLLWGKIDESKAHLKKENERNKKAESRLHEQLKATKKALTTAEGKQHSAEKLIAKEKKRSTELESMVNELSTKIEQQESAFNEQKKNFENLLPGLIAATIEQLSAQYNETQAANIESITNALSETLLNRLEKAANSKTR